MKTYDHLVPGGAGWSLTVPRRHAMRLAAVDDGANVSMLVFAAADPLERLCVPDTLKAQMSACLRPPMVLMSDLGRALCSVTGSSLAWHDAITGHGPAARVLLLDELAVLGLGRRDLHACANWFSKVVPDGGLSFVPGHCRAGDWVTLRAEQDLLVVLATAAHPMDPAGPAAVPPAAVRVTVTEAPAPGDDDPSRVLRAESARALELAERCQA